MPAEGEANMRMLTAAALLAAISLMQAAQAADVYPPPAYGAAPVYQPAPVYQYPPVVGYVPPAVYPPPPAMAYGAPPAPRVYARPPGVIAAPEGPAYVVPGPVYQPGDEYVGQTVMVDDARYYRHCRWEFGYRRCYLRHKAWFW
jgi:hypothetical protein